MPSGECQNRKTSTSSKVCKEASISSEVYFKSSWLFSTIRRLMKKDIPFQLDEACDKVFKSIKSYLMKPPVLVAPVPGRPLILYVAAQERSLGILLAQKNDEGKENALYCLSRTMMPNELKYPPIEELCLTLIFSIQKLKHYFQSHCIHLVSKGNPLKYVMAKPVLSDRLARWYLQLQQFEITYVKEADQSGKRCGSANNQKTVKN
ncbi:UNVERIFIED_CONTAM: hypothetical protein Sangu_2527500 [Sesamum angustifolium]|uniref:Reverse transcriptase RNase H-like domain-containing protein n=1 Tax=Sesamum angustifolium TaxID=2727405 RepID=A0AAW2JE53_9LAMI